MSGQTMVIQPGDTMISIAHSHGYRNWQAIYGHPRNATLRARYPDPSLLLPGETVFLPEKGTDPRLCQTTRRHVFRVKRLRARMRFSVGDEDRVFARARYELWVDGERFEGTTDGDGVIDVRVSPGASTARVSVWADGDDSDPWEWTLRVGHLDPIDSDSGLRGRLANLGYPADDGDDGLREALSRFQFDAKIEVTGVLDDPTLAKLRERSGT